jgi:hypothetical protein
LAGVGPSTPVPRRDPAGARGRRDGEGAALRVVRLSAAVLAIAAAAAALAFSVVPYETLKDHVDGFAVDDDAGVTRDSFDALVLRARLLAAAFALAGLALLRYGRPLDAVLAAVFGGWASAARAAPGRLRGWATRQPADAAALGLLSALALALRLSYLDVPLRYDEATTYVNYVSKPLYVALSNYSEPNNHLLHTAVAKLSVTLFGSGTTALRLPALIAGVALVPATFALGHALYGRGAGLVGAAVTATSSVLVEYSVNARGYTIVALLTVVGLLAAIRIVAGDSLPAWAFLAVTLAVGLYAVPVMIYPAGGIAVWIALSRLAAGEALRPVGLRLLACSFASAALAAVLYAPVLLASGPRSVTSNEFVSPQSWRDLAARLPEHVADTVQTWTRDVPAPLAAALAVALVISLAPTRRLGRHPIPPLLAVLAWSLPLLLAQRVVPFTRVWIFALPVAAVALGAMLAWPAERLWRRRGAAIATAAALATAASWAVLASDSPRTSRETGGLLDAPAVAGYLADVVTPKDRILATGSDTILQYYLDARGIESGPLLYTAEPRRRVFAIVNVLGDQTLAQLLDELGDARTAYAAPHLVRRWPSASAYVLERRGGRPGG